MKDEISTTNFQDLTYSESIKVEGGSIPFGLYLPLSAYIIPVIVGKAVVSALS